MSTAAPRRGLANRVVAAVMTFALAAPVTAQTSADYQRVVDQAYDTFKNLQEGKNADYIPALAKVPSNLFGIALVTPDGRVFTAGDLKTEVSIQSVSKVFTMAKVMQDSGLAALE